MVLATGTRLGPYEITAQIGVGGMGEVYRATDTNLKRQVAIKALPASVAAEPERLARFQREAEVLAALNHPNIAQIHGLEKADGVTALVMELVEGPTLADRIARGPIPVDEALAIAKQIAEALEAAHEQGIIHRDLKPANIKVRDDGTVKVLDFGLAKALGREPASAAAADITHSPTITSPAMTQKGVILGTAAYMSPEQARGKAIDKRTDIWAFGCVLYEMLTGRRAFEGEDVSLTLAAIMKSDVDLNSLPADTTASLRVCLQQCLQKDPKERLRDIGDARLALEGAFQPAPSQLAAVTAPQSVWRRLLLVAAAAAVASFATALAAWTFWPTLEPGKVRRFSVALPASQTLPPNAGTLVGISADGQTLVYRALEGGVTRIFVRALGSLESRVVPGTDGAAVLYPPLSPDGQWLYFRSGTYLMKVSLAGGRPLRVADIGNSLRGASWESDDTLVLARRTLGLLRLPLGGDPPLTLVAPDDAREYWYPQVLPGGRAILYTASTPAADAGDLMVLDLGTGVSRTLLRDAVAGRYIRTGHLLFLRGEDLWAMRFDPGAVSVSGDAVVVEQGIRIEAGGAVQFDVANDGTLMYVPSDSQNRTLVWVDRQGRESPVPVEPGPFISPRVSPDGTRIAVATNSGQFDVWLSNRHGAGLSRVTHDPARDGGPVWSADGQRLIFFSTRLGPRNLFRRSVDGTGDAERLTTSPNEQWPTDVSRDGTILVFTEGAQGTGADVMQLALDGTGRITPLVQSRATERNGALSPDGRWLAYDSDDSGQFEVYVLPFPALDRGRVKVSPAGGTRPVWGPDGRELFYVATSGAVMSVMLERDLSRVHAPMQVVKEGYETQTSASYDVDLDGQRFLMLKAAPQSDQRMTNARLIVVENLFEELKRLLPVK